MGDNLNPQEREFLNRIIAEEESKQNAFGATMYRNLKNSMNNFFGSIKTLKWKLNEQIFLATMDDNVFARMHSERATKLKEIADIEEKISNEVNKKQSMSDIDDTDESAFNSVKLISQNSEIRSMIDRANKLVFDMRERNGEPEPALNDNDYLFYVVNMLCGTADYTSLGDKTEDELKQIYKNCYVSDDVTKMDIETSNSVIRSSDDVIVWMMIEPPIWFAKLLSDDNIIIPTTVKTPITDPKNEIYKHILTQLKTIKNSKKGGRSYGGKRRKTRRNKVQGFKKKNKKSLRKK